MKEQKLSPREDRSSEQKSGGAEQDHFTGLLARSFEEKPIWSGLYESLSDAFFPPNLPPLELTSTPVPTPDRMAARTNPWAIGTATIANGSILALLIFLGFTSALRQPPSLVRFPPAAFISRTSPSLIPAAEAAAAPMS